MKLHNKIFKSLGYMLDDENSMDGTLEYIKNTPGNIKKISITVEDKLDTIVIVEQQWNKNTFHWDDVDTTEVSGEEHYAITEVRKFLGAKPESYEFCKEINKVKRRKCEDN